MVVIHLVEGVHKRPREGEIVRTKCDKDITFRPFSPSLKKRIPYCVDCHAHTRIVTRIPNFLAVSGPPAKGAHA